MKSWVGIAFFGISMLLRLLPPTMGNRGVSMEILRLCILMHTFYVENEPTFQVSHLEILCTELLCIHSSWQPKLSFKYNQWPSWMFALPMDVIVADICLWSYRRPLVRPRSSQPTKLWSKWNDCFKCLHHGFIGYTEKGNKYVDQHNKFSCFGPKCHSTSAFPNLNTDSAEAVIRHMFFLLTSSPTAHWAPQWHTTALLWSFGIMLFPSSQSFQVHCWLYLFA